METHHPPRAPVSPAPASHIEAELQRIRALMERGEFAAALAQASRLLAEVPENRDVLYVVAVCERYLNRVPDALATLTRLEQLHPSYSRLFQERGHCHVTQRAAQPAIDAFLRAVNLNPALPASWKALHSLYRLTGQQDNAATAASHVDTLAGLPVEVVTASSMLADGELQPAERIIRQFLLKHGDHVEAMRVLAKIGMKLGVFDDAETLLERLLELAPDYQAARFDYARVLLDRHRDAKALSELETLLKAEPAEPFVPGGGRLGAGRNGRCGRSGTALPGAAGGDPAGPGAPPVRGARAQDIRSVCRGRGRLPHSRAAAPGLRRCLLEPGEPQDLPLHR